MAYKTFKDAIELIKQNKDKLNVWLQGRNQLDYTEEYIMAEVFKFLVEYLESLDYEEPTANTVFSENKDQDKTEGKKLLEFFKGKSDCNSDGSIKKTPYHDSDGLEFL